MNDKQLRITRHAYRRYRQRVGSMVFKRLRERSQTALLCGLYRQGEGLIKLCGVWWGCVEYQDAIVLTTCLGRSTTMPKPERRRGPDGNASETTL